MNRRKLPAIFILFSVFVLTQGACVFGEVLDANPAGSAIDHVGTMTAQAGSTQDEATITPEPSSTSTDPQTIPGVWHGIAQWLCGDNPVWDARMEFKANGAVSAVLTTATEYASADGSWVASGDGISIQFEYGLWVGTITDGTIEGTFAEENCSGIWIVTKD